MFVMLAALAVPAARRHWIDCFCIDRAHIRVAVGLRTGLGMALVLLLAHGLGRLDLGVPLSLGILFGNLGDFGDPYGVRARTMLYTTLACAAFSLLGGLVSVHGYWHLPAAILAGAAVGYAGAMGPASGLVGVFCLALFAFYAASAITPVHALTNSLCLLLGGATATGLTLLAWPLRQLQPARHQLAIAYRKLAEACALPAERWSDSAIAGAVLAAGRSVRLSGTGGDTQRWANTLLAGAEHTRTLIFALAPLRERQTDTAALDGLLATTGQLCATVAVSLQGRGTASQLEAALAALESACERAKEADMGAAAVQLRRVLGETVRALSGQWPVGRRATMAAAVRDRAELGSTLRQHLKSGDRFRRHAVQLALTFGLATAISLGPWGGLLAHHQFWIPLTVAWICKPEAGGTLSKLGMRIWGTSIGVVASALFLLFISDPHVIALLLGVSAFLRSPSSVPIIRSPLSV